MRITCASLERSEPFGSSRSSVSSVTFGSSPLSEISSGAPIGRPASTEAAIALCQSSASTSTTAVGRSLSPVAGNSAPATPAASEAASAPPMRIVLRVALEGKPSLFAASSSPDLTPSCGGLESSSPTLQPLSSSSERQRATSAERATDAPEGSCRPGSERLPRRVRCRCSDRSVDLPYD